MGIHESLPFKVGRSIILPMIIEFSGKIIFWRGPAPWFFIAVTGRAVCLVCAGITLA